ncbi:hypothetical protein K439DRAFT_97418 [Ramaria rubella]|nr:hypothetical protein K439DRAFT_97418 [Ramaria rubella]
MMVWRKLMKIGACAVSIFCSVVGAVEYHACQQDVHCKPSIIDILNATPGDEHLPYALIRFLNWSKNIGKQSGCEEFEM